MGWGWDGDGMEKLEHTAKYIKILQIKGVYSGSLREWSVIISRLRSKMGME